jgi:hypothetical protein
MVSGDCGMHRIRLALSAQTNDAYLNSPGVYATSGVTSLPDSSSGLRTLYDAITETATIHTVSVARKRPGQILIHGDQDAAKETVFLSSI